MFIIGGVQQEVLKIELQFRAGRWFESAPGISHFTGHMIEKGTLGRSAADIAEAFDSLGAHIEITPGFDQVEISLYALQKNWDKAFSLLVEIIQSPSFDGEELDQMKIIFLQNLKVNLAKNSFVASQALRRKVFGDHPYGVSPVEEDIDKITATQLKAYHIEKFGVDSVFVTAPDSISKDTLLEKMHLLPGPKNEKQSLLDVKPGAKVEIIEKEGSVQTSLRLGRRIVLRGHPDYPQMLLFNHLLGGYFGSRLMKNIREEKGLTYGIYSSLNPFQRDGFLVIGADVNKDNRQLAMDEIEKEVKTLRTEPVGAEELEIACNHFLGSLQLEIANPFSVTDKVKNLHINSLPSDYYDTLFRKIEATTSADLLRIGEQHFNEKEMHHVLVG